METDAPLAPPVVAVVVVHRPAAWFEETLESLAGQDYPNLDTLFLVVGDAVGEDGVDVRDRIGRLLPNAFVREVAGNPGFGAAANEVLQLVDGDNGFFCICHDDVALEPDTVRLLVEELYRSNAGIVGPKLVSWDDPAVLQHVGLGVDRFGEIEPTTEPGEYDQEQHDAVRDVFVLPSACLLTRADLFRTLGGFDTAITFHGDDVDLCWRAHVSGARVVVAPQARVRHREELTARRPELNHDLLRARHRMRSVATLTSGPRLPVRAVELVLLSVVELVVGLFTARFGEAWASLRALVGLVPRTPTLLARRRTIAKLRRVDDEEILRLHTRGSARVARYRRARDTETFIGTDATVNRWRESPLSTTITWIVVAAWILIASRTMFDRKVPVVGEMFPLPASPRDWWSDFVSAWNPSGLGATTSNPTGWGLLSITSVFSLFRMGLGTTVFVVGLVFLGVWGAWKLATVFPSNRARIAALLVYAAVPLVPGAISTGRVSALIAYATIPWFVHLLRVAVGIGTADPAAAADDLVDGVIDLGLRERLRRSALLVLVAAGAVALAPSVLPVLVIVAVVLGLTSLAADAGMRTAAWMAGIGVGACAAAWVLNLPWSTTLSWNDLAAPPLAGAPGRGVVDVATMAIGRGRFETLAIVLYVPVLVALLVSRAWRLTWAARAAGLVVVFLGVAVLQDRDALPFRVPEVGVLLAPVGLGLAISAAAAIAAFGHDVAGRDFGWRQPLGLLSIVTVALGVLPALLTVSDGAWFAPRTGLTTLVEGPQAPASAVGDYRVLYLGDPRVIPFPTDDLGNGVAMAVVDDGPSDMRDRWPAADGPADDALRDVVRQVSSSGTRRAGRLLAPFGIRYIVIPVVDGATSTASDPLPVPGGIVEAFGAQLDLVRSHTTPSFVQFENRAAIATTTLLTGSLADVSQEASVDAWARVDTTTATPVFVGADRNRQATGAVEAGVVQFASPLDSRWELTVAGQNLTARASSGVATAYDVPTAGQGTFRYEQPSSRTVALAVQALLWLAVLVAASRLALPSRLRPRQRAVGGAVIDLDADRGLDPADRGAAMTVPVGRLMDDPAPSVPAPEAAVAPVRELDDDAAAEAWVDELFAEDADNEHGDRS